MNDRLDNDPGAKQIMSDSDRRGARSETQTATVATRDQAPPARPESPARVSGDVDESREIPTDIVVRQAGEPDAVAQGPAAAPSMTDEEAGGAGRAAEGGITPLTRRGS